MSKRWRQEPAGAEVPVRPDPTRGVFETMLVVRGRPVELAAHLERLERSLAVLYGAALPADAAELVVAEAEGLGLGRVRLAIACDDPHRPCVKLEGRAVDPGMVFPSWEAGTVLSPLVVPGGIGAHKWVDRTLLDEEDGRTGNLSLVVDADDGVLEASRANVFAVLGGAVVTPEADGRLLPGVTRGCAIEVLGDLGVECVQRGLALRELLEADEVFLTGSIRGVEPVVTCGTRRWSPAGTVWARLSRSLARRWGVPGQGS